MDPPRAKPRLLNKALLPDIASTAAKHYMRRHPAHANNVAGLYMLDKRFNGKVLRHLEKGRPPLEILTELFAAILEHSGLAFPTVTLTAGGEHSKMKWTGVELLEFICADPKWTTLRQDLRHWVRIIHENKSSLKALVDVPEVLFPILPWGLVLNKFSIRNVEPRNVKLPYLNMKVFKYDIYDIADDVDIPMRFMSCVKAEEIHLRIHGLRASSPKKPFNARSGNRRTKMLRVVFVNADMHNLDFGRIFREVAVCFPKLECFELVRKKRYSDNESDPDHSYTYDEFADAVDRLVSGFERALTEVDTALREAGTAKYTVHLKAHVWYTYSNEEVSTQVIPEEADFNCGMLQTDLPPSEEVEPGKQHAYFAKEISTDAGTLRVDCEIVEGTESDDGSDTDDDSDSEDSVGTAIVADTPSDTDDDIRSCNDDSVISFIHLFAP